MSKLVASIILPCFNEGPTLKDSIEKIISELEKINWKWELIFVEDKSLDDSKDTINKIVSSRKNTRAIFHKQNLGRGKSVADGIKEARGKICGYLDVDLEVGPEYIGIFLEEVKRGADVVVGKRFYERNFKSLARFLASKFYALIVKKSLKLPVDDTEAGYKFFNRAKILPVLDRVKNKRWFWDTEICARSYYGGLKLVQVPVLYKRRSDKKSTVSLIPDTISYIRALSKFRKQFRKSDFYDK